jgi:hypothetical protein
MGGDPLFWLCFDYENTSKSSRYRDLLVQQFVSISVPPNHTNRDVLELISRESHIPIESVPEELTKPVDPGSRVVFGFAGVAIDEIACNYVNMRWWVSDGGLKMAMVVAPNPPHIPTLDELMLDLYGGPWSAALPSDKLKANSFEPHSEDVQVLSDDQVDMRPVLPVKTERPPGRRHPKYERIDERLRSVAEAHPRSHEEAFRLLEDRAGIPDAEPFRTSRSWYAGFQADPVAARAWLAKRWSQLKLPPFARGPK